MARSIAAAEQFVVGGCPQRLAQMEASSWPRQVCSVPVQVIRTRLQDFAEIMRHRRDEAELAAGFADADVARRAAGLIVEVGQGVLLASRARSSDNGTYWSMRPSPMSPIGITSISVSAMPCGAPIPSATGIMLASPSLFEDDF